MTMSSASLPDPKSAAMEWLGTPRICLCESVSLVSEHNGNNT